MCAICQNGPAILAGVPVAGLAVARLRRAVAGVAGAVRSTANGDDEPPAGTEPREDGR